MCLAIPGKIKKVEKNQAYFDYDGREYAVDVSLISAPKIGDWILMHDGRAMSKIDENEARENLEFIEQQNKENNSGHHH